MKRLISFVMILLMAISLSACSPDNIISPEQTKPEQQQKPQDQGEQKPSGNETADGTPSHPTHTDKKSKNSEVMPTFDINTLDYVKVKTDSLKEKNLTMFVGDSSFTAANLSEKDWIAKACELLGIKSTLFQTSDSKLYESQLIAQTAGKKLDLISVRIDDMAATSTLVSSAETLVTPSANDPFSNRVFDLSGKKLFAGIGNAKVLWYNKKIIEKDQQNDWTFDDFKSTFELAKNKNAAFAQTDSFIEFFSCGNQQMSGFDAQNGYIMNVQDKTARDMVAEFAKLTNAEGMMPTAEKTFQKGSAAYTYTDTPSKGDFEVSWVPLPRYGQDGTNVMSLCASALGISKNIPEENKDTALTFAMLWCARYTESREDKLLFDIQISSASYDQYIDLCEKNGRIYQADKTINNLFVGTGIPHAFYLDDPYNGVAPSVSSVFYTVPQAYERADLINKRYR